MAISDADSKLLWGRAAGLCSNPSCRTDLTAVLEDRRSYNIGEMAHVIARNENGPRGVAGGGEDNYENLILLCPSCHRHIDKAPEGEYTVEQLFEWKKQHEEEIRSVGTEKKYIQAEELKRAVTMLLLENRMIWEEYGPESATATTDPGSNSHEIWELRKPQTIFPNNQKILNLITANIDLLNGNEYRLFLMFKSHAVSFEANHYCRLDRYTLFPQEFSEAFYCE